MDVPVNFEIAKLVEEKGFQPKGPIAEYWEVDSRWFLINTWEDEYDTLHHEDSPDDMIFLCSAPTIAEVVMWLYEKHGIWIGVQRDWDAGQCLGFEGIIDGNDGIINTKTLNSPTEAYEAGIKHVLENLI